MPNEINAAFLQIWVSKIIVEHSYVEEPRGECVEDSAVTTRDLSAFAIFTNLEHADELFGIHVASKIIRFLLREATDARIYEVLVRFVVVAV